MAKIPHPGAFPSKIDQRDWLHKVVSKTKIEDIPAVGGIDDVPLIIHDQGDMPTCTGEAGAYAQMINQYFETGRMIDLSALFIYKMNREIDGLPPDTEGSTVKATVDTLRLRGVCREILYPSTRENYDKSLPNSRQMGRIMRNAYMNRIISYTKCLDLDDVLVALSEKRPVIFSMYLLSNFYRARNGKVPKQVGGSNVGGHAMVALGYNMEEKWVKVAQSWGERSSLTDRGYMYIPFTWFNYQVKEDFPMLMEAYAVLDYIPDEIDRIPTQLTISKNPVSIEVNGKIVKNMDIPPLLVNELGVPLVNTKFLEKIIQELTRQKVIVEWNPDTNTILINI